MVQLESNVSKSEVIKSTRLADSGSLFRIGDYYCFPWLVIPDEFMKKAGVGVTQRALSQ